MIQKKGINLSNEIYNDSEYNEFNEWITNLNNGMIVKTIVELEIVNIMIRQKKKKKKRYELK